MVLGVPSALAKLEAIVHPLVRAAEAEFLREAREAAAPVVVLDIPLLFESGRDRDVDLVVVVSAGADEQRRRVMERPGMTEERFAAISARQTPDAEKRRRADFVIDTSNSVEQTRAQVRALLNELGSKTEAGRDA
jgi:dephospho-CoA kinase